MPPMKPCEIWCEHGAAKKDQLRAKHRLGKFLLRHGRRPPTGVKPWTLNYLSWVKHEVHFEQMAQEATLLDSLHEVEHAELRIARLTLGTGESSGGDDCGRTRRSIAILAGAAADGLRWDRSERTFQWRK